MNDVGLQWVCTQGNVIKLAESKIQDYGGKGVKIVDGSKWEGFVLISHSCG